MSEPADTEAWLSSLGRAYDPLRERFGSRHGALLASIHGATWARLEAEPLAEGRFCVSVCAVDAPGVLSIIAGLLASRGVDIRHGDAFTLRPEKPAPTPVGPRRRIRRVARPRRVASGRVVDVFEVRVQGDPEPGFWRDLETELSALVGQIVDGKFDAAFERVALGVSAAVAGMRGGDGDEPLPPISVALDNDADPRSTELRIQSSDTPGFLFGFVNALTLLDLDIDRVEIRTLYGQAHDTFWVTDAAGRKLESAQRIQELKVATVLIKEFAHLLPRSANPAQALQQFSRFVSELLRRPDWTAALEPLGSGDVLRTLAEMMGVSRFLWEDFLRLQHENLFPVLADAPRLEDARSREEIAAELAAELRGQDAEGAAATLNRCKDREMFRIDLRHITHRIGLEAFSAELTALAEAVVEAAGRLCVDALRERPGGFGRPWSICGAGKLGGRELGFASDIELIFVFERAEDDPPEMVMRFEEFVQHFLRTLTARQNGVFEIDLRLRPHGSKGSLACTLDAFQAYYAPGGEARQLERMALVKLRPVAGDVSLGERVEEARDAFVYSGEPVDRDEIRRLRRRQVEESVRPGTTNAKFSPGGLVDLEYFVQARQIEAGCERPELRVPNTVEAATRLARAGVLDPDLVAQLTASYRFLRRVIDALRVVRGNARDLAIPAPGSRDFDYLARRLGYGSPERLGADMERHMGFARSLWG